MQRPARRKIQGRGSYAQIRLHRGTPHGAPCPFPGAIARPGATNTSGWRNGLGYGGNRGRMRYIAGWGFLPSRVSQPSGLGPNLGTHAVRHGIRGQGYPGPGSLDPQAE